MHVRSSIYYIISRVGAGALSLVAISLFARALGPSGYAHLNLAVSIGGVLVGAVSSPLCQGFGRFFGAEGAKGVLHAQLVRVLGHVLVALLGIALLAELFLPQHDLAGVFLGGVLLFGAQGVFDLSSQNSNVSQRPSDYATQAVVKGGLLVVLALFVTRLPHPVYASLAAMVVSFLSAAAIFSWRHWLCALRTRLDMQVLRPLLRFALPVVGVAGLAALQQWSDRWLVAGLAGRTQAGLYAATADILVPVLMLIASTSYLTWYPRLVLAWDADDKAAVRGIASRHLSQTLFLLAPAGVGLVAVGPELLPLVLGPRFAASTASLLPWLVLAGAFAGLRSSVLDVSLYVLHRTHLLLIPYGGMLASMVAANVMLTPRFGAQGAAWSAVISGAVGALLSAWLGRTGVPWRMSLATLLQIVLACVAELVAVKVASRDGVTGLMGQCVAGALAYLAVVLTCNTMGARMLVMRVFARMRV